MLKYEECDGKKRQFLSGVELDSVYVNGRILFALREVQLLFDLHQGRTGVTEHMRTIGIFEEIKKGKDSYTYIDKKTACRLALHPDANGYYVDLARRECMSFVRDMNYFIATFDGKYNKGELELVNKEHNWKNKSSQKDKIYFRDYELKNGIPYVVYEGEGWFLKKQLEKKLNASLNLDGKRTIKAYVYKSLTNDSISDSLWVAENEMNYIISQTYPILKDRDLFDNKEDVDTDIEHVELPVQSLQENIEALGLLIQKKESELDKLREELEEKKSQLKNKKELDSKKLLHEAIENMSGEELIKVLETCLSK